ncbi:MAG: hypothetical protein IJ867_05285 [Clostridia bacterium]|nr:hypothetical protein [Clostridia bacterium]
MISKKYNEILTKLEENIEDKRDFNLAKSALSDLAICYIDELTKLNENYNFKISSFEARLSELEKKLQEEEETLDATLVEGIACPYCGFEFNVEYDDTKTETTCPNCSNLIELDWGEFEDDM